MESNMVHQENAMAREINANSTSRDEAGRSAVPSIDKDNEQTPHGKALEVNENSVGGKQPTLPPAPSRSSKNPNEHKVQGNALRVNEYSIKDHGPDRVP
jgi:hypothetical protein